MRGDVPFINFSAFGCCCCCCCCCCFDCCCCCVCFLFVFFWGEIRCVHLMASRRLASELDTNVSRTPLVRYPTRRKAQTTRWQEGEMRRGAPARGEKNDARWPPSPTNVRPGVGRWWCGSAIKNRAARLDRN